MKKNPWAIGYEIRLDADSLEWLLDGNEDRDLFDSPSPLTKIGKSTWEITEGNNSIRFTERGHKVLKILIENVESLPELEYVKETYGSEIISNEYQDLVGDADTRLLLTLVKGSISSAR
jgi:hypothetical protein